MRGRWGRALYVQGLAGEVGEGEGWWCGCIYEEMVWEMLGETLEHLHAYM